MGDRGGAALPEAAASASGRRYDAAALVVLVLLPLFTFRVVPGGLPPYGGDLLVHVYPLLSLLAHGLHSGRPVLWNPYAAGGYPLAPYGALALSPPMVVALLTLPVTAALAALYVGYDALLGVGMYWLAGECGLSRPARLLAALTLACCGFVAAHTYAGHLLELGAVAPLPLALVLLHRAIERVSLAWALLCGAVVGAMVLAAGAQFLPFVLAALPLLTLWRAVSGWQARRSHRWAAVFWPLVALVLVALTAAALAAVFLLPFREIVAYALRSGALDYGTATRQGLLSAGWGGLLPLVAPTALGTPADGSYWPASRFGPYFHEIYAYAGLLPLLLTPLALWRTRAARPIGALALLALVVMLGDTPLYHLLYSLPGGALLRAPARAGLLFDGALALLAGYGLDALGQRPVGRLLLPGIAVALAAAVGVVVALALPGVVPPVGRGLALAGLVRLAVVLLVAVVACLLAARRRLALLLPALALLDLVGANASLLRPSDPARFYSASAAVQAAPTGPVACRLLALDGAVPVGLGMVTRRLYDTQDLAPLALAGYWRLSHSSEVARAGGGVVETGRDTISVADLDPLFLRLFGVCTLFSAQTLPLPGLHRTGSVTSQRWRPPGGAMWNVVPYTATSLIYHNALALPRLFTVTRAVTVGSAAAALTALQRGALDPARVAVLSPGEAPLPAALAALQRAWGGWLAGASDNAVTVGLGGGGGRYLVVDDGWFPGWIASVDGQPTPVLRADYLLRAVQVPAGRHTVRLVYAPLSYLAGAVVSLLAALVVGLAALRLALRWAATPRRG